jgi:phosphohistidine phosphatase
VVSITRPGKLPKKFPYPSPRGNERRDRPAYYYTQSSVVPWRINNGELEILVILSSKKKHWVVPKGILEPGLSARESAAREALEEAGIEGVVSDEAIGSYTYPKWGASCTVEVYGMEVTRMLPEEEWQEAHRSRQWVPLKQAASKLGQKKLKPLLRQLATRVKKRKK